MNTHSFLRRVVIVSYFFRNFKQIFYKFMHCHVMQRKRDRSAVPPENPEKEQDSTDELSPADSAPSSDSSDSDSDLPLLERLDSSKRQHLGGL
jgi:hypothetical protein